MNGNREQVGWTYDVRPADPYHRGDHEDATEVVVYFDGKPQRIMGVFETARIATMIAGVLNQYVHGQVR